MKILNSDNVNKRLIKQGNTEEQQQKKKKNTLLDINIENNNIFRICKEFE